MKSIKNFRNRIKLEYIKRDDNEKSTKRQSKSSHNGIHEPYANFDSYTFKQNEVLLNKGIYLGFTLLELNKLLMHET